MKLCPQSPNLKDYLKESNIINFSHADIQEKIHELKRNNDSELEQAKAVFHFVRDEVSHSFDINGSVVTCLASDVLTVREGICYAKSHLLAALLRGMGIPAGFCYQLLILDDDEAPKLIIHGLNAFYSSELKKWIRLDARGNKEGVNAQFLTDSEQLAFPVRPEKGEKDFDIIYTEPSTKVIESLVKASDADYLFKNLAVEL